MGAPYKFTPDEVIAALKKHDGLQAAAANTLGCCQRTIRYYAERFPEVQEVIDHLKETMLDEAETQLYKKIKAGDLGAICFFLKTQGKARHYSERIQITDGEGKPLQPPQIIVMSESSREGVQRLLSGERLKSAAPSLN